MNMPSFTAEYSLYRSRNTYRVVTAESGALRPAQSIVLSLSPEGAAACHDCEQSCFEEYSICMAVALATVWIPLLGGGIGLSCVAGSWYCLARCHADGHACCPKSCGSYCCSYGEQCSHYSGCCPGDRIVCGGRCCAAGESCCGDTCCASGRTCCGDTCCPNNCCGDTCCDAGVPCCGDTCCNLLTPPGTPPPKPPLFSCPPGAAPCGFPDSSGVIRTCCPPGLQCCGVFNGQPDCKTSCLH